MIVCCSWCHEDVDLAVDGSCPACGHDAGVCRMECGCARCHATRLMLGLDSDDPPVAGGCGRSTRDMVDAATICVGLAAATIAMVVLAMAGSIR